MKVNAFAVLGAVVAISSLVGCTLRESSDDYDRRPVRVVEQPAYGPPPGPVVYQPAPQPQVVYQQEIPQQVVVVQEPPPQPLLVVRTAPPPVRYEQIPPNPGRGAIWTGGYWVAQPNGWYWVSGRWSMPPRANAVYVAPHWDHVGTEFHLTVGGWR